MGGNGIMWVCCGISNCAKNRNPSIVFFGKIILSLSILGACFYPSSAFGQAGLIDSLNQQAYHLYREDVAESKKIAYQAFTLAEEIQAIPQMVDSYINLSRCFRLESKWDSAYWVLNQAIEWGEKVDYVEGLMNSTNNLAACYLMQGEIDHAEPYLKKSLAYAQTMKDAKGQANAYNNLAIIAEARFENDTALVYLNGALAVYQQIGDSSGIARIFMNQAFIFDDQEKNDSAIIYNFKALRILEVLGLVSDEASVRTQIGGLYDEKESEDKALEQYEMALNLYEDIGDIQGMALANNNIGIAIDKLGRPQEALPFLEKGLELARKTEDPEMIGAGLVNLADFYLSQGLQMEKAKEMFLEAISYLEEAEEQALSTAYYGLGRFFMIKDQLEVAKKWFQKALETASYFEDLNSQKLTYWQLSYIYEKQGNLAKALNFIKEYQSLNDSLINLESLETINKLNIEFESEKKEKENLQLENELTKSELVNAKQKVVRNQILGIGSLIVFVGLIGFIWFRYRQRIRIKEQEVELEKQRLRKEQQEKEAEKLRELDAMKTRFFTNISHEFRTPLTLIIGKNDQMQAAVDDPKLQSGFEMVGRNGHRLLDLVNQVLDVAKLESGGMNLEMSQLDAILFLKHMFYSFESMSQEQGINLIFESDLKKLNTAFDHKKIERVIFNLLSNAIKFTPDGGEISMQVAVGSMQSKTSQLPTADSSLPTEDCLLVTISDSGVGIKASQLPYIFNRFYQADSSENQPQPGTGIGLSLVKELVALHQGNIEVASELNKGTIFIISLPIPASLDEFSFKAVDTQLSPEALPSKTITGNQEPSAAATKREQILLVEDNDDIRAFVKEQILSFGYQVYEARDGIEGLEKAQELIPDLIISDIMMPRLDGYGVAKGLKEDEKTSHIPVILLTSKASEESRIAGLELGVDDYLLKPFNAKELEVRIGNLIKQRKRLREKFSTATVIRPNEVSAVSMDQVFLKKVLNSIEENLANEQFGVESLADDAGMSVNNLNRKLSALVDQTAGKLIRSMRLQRAADLLKQKAGTIAEIAYDTGFNSHASFNRSFKQQFGVSPTTYQKEQG